MASLPFLVGTYQISTLVLVPPLLGDCLTLHIPTLFVEAILQFVAVNHTLQASLNVGQASPHIVPKHPLRCYVAPFQGKAVSFY